MIKIPAWCWATLWHPLHYPREKYGNVLNLSRVLRRKCLHGTTRNFHEIESLPFSGPFAKFCGSCSSRSAVPRDRSTRKNLIASQKLKILRTEVRKVWRKCGFSMRFCPFVYNKRKARQDKMFILTLMLYCTSKSCKIQVAKEKKLVTLATILVAISSPVISLSLSCFV